MTYSEGGREGGREETEHSLSEQSRGNFSVYQTQPLHQPVG